MTRGLCVCRVAAAALVLALACLGPAACTHAEGPPATAEGERGPAGAPLAIGVGDPLVGRAALADRVLLLTASGQLLEVWPRSGTVVQNPVSGLEAGARVRGLARLDDGSLWTLLGRDEVVEITGGRTGRRLALPGPAVALYGARDRLVHQAVDFDPPAPALVAAPPGSAARHTWGPLRTRRLGRSRAEEMVHNVVVCGLGLARLMPCWFPVGDEVAVIDQAGNGHVVHLEGVRLMSAEDVLTASASTRALRDIFARATDDVWVLGADVLGPPTHESPAQWQLVQFDGQGRAVQVKALDQACRIFLAMSEQTAWLLANDGSIVRVAL